MGEVKAQRKYSKHGKTVKIEVLSEDEFVSMSDYYIFCPYCGGLIARKERDEDND